MRSLLLIPGDNIQKLEEGFTSKADALLIDLENSVAINAKDKARNITTNFIAQYGRQNTAPKLFVRVNHIHSPQIDADLDAVTQAQADGIMLAKANHGNDVTHLDVKLTVHETRYGIDEGTTPILATSAQTAVSLFNMESFVGSNRRLIGLAWDADALSQALGAQSNRDKKGSLLPPYQLARSLVLFAAKAANITAIDTAYPWLNNPKGLIDEAKAAYRDGFAAKIAIDPMQIEPINSIFTAWSVDSQ